MLVVPALTQTYLSIPIGQNIDKWVNQKHFDVFSMMHLQGQSQWVSREFYGHYALTWYYIDEEMMKVL